MSPSDAEAPRVGAGRRPLCGIFVGGAARRMLGLPKGLLPAPEGGQPLVVRLCELGQAAGLDCVLVGQRAEYQPLGLPMLVDRPAGIGPLGGLVALLEAAQAAGHAEALALSCDLPHLSAALVGRLLSDDPEPSAGVPWEVLAPQRAGRWEPLFARYRVSLLPSLQALILAGERSFQRLFGRLRVTPFLLRAGEAHELDDWDEPSDLPPSLRDG